MPGADCVLRCCLQDLQLIQCALTGLDALAGCRDATLRTLSRTARLERHQANDVLYQ